MAAGWQGRGTRWPHRRSPSEMKSRALLVALCLLAGGCTDFPKDPDGTLDRIRSERRFTVGIVAGQAKMAALERAYVARVAAAAGARPEVATASAEELIGRLAAGKIDLLVGEFGASSPWSRHVSFLPPLHERTTPSGNLLLVPAAANGENAWIGLLYREAKALQAEKAP